MSISLEQGIEAYQRELDHFAEVVVFEATDSIPSINYELHGQSVKARSVREYRGDKCTITEAYIEDFPQLKLCHSMQYDFIPSEVSLSKLPEVRVLFERR
jgi:hypothetical protein